MAVLKIIIILKRHNGVLTACQTLAPASTQTFFRSYRHVPHDS